MVCKETTSSQGSPVFIFIQEPHIEDPLCAVSDKLPVASGWNRSQEDIER